MFHARKFKYGKQAIKLLLIHERAGKYYKYLITLNSKICAATMLRRVVILLSRGQFFYENL